MLLLLNPANLCRANPGVITKGGTRYLKDADSYVGKAPLMPKISRESNSAAKQVPSASPSGSTTPTPANDVSDHFDYVQPTKAFPSAIIHRSALIVGQQIPVPAQYAAPQVILSQNSSITIVPATPTTFRVIQTGTTMGDDGNGHITVRDTELNGFVDYGRPIQTIAPVQNQQGQPMGSQIITTVPNLMLIPVTTAIEMK